MGGDICLFDQWHIKGVFEGNLFEDSNYFSQMWITLFTFKWYEKAKDETEC